jgi:hypothetical protein
MLRNRFDGTMTYVEEMNAWVEMRPELRQFPFDRESFEIVLHPLGLNRDEVVLSPSSDIGVPGHGISIAEWQLGDVSASARGPCPLWWLRWSWPGARDPWCAWSSSR